MLEHDFGILKPKERVEHRFVIKNDTAARWTVRKIINSCSCTGSDPSASEIEPGKEESITVTYRAGGVTQDDRRRVVVLFQEEKAPRVQLVVRARVREPVTCVPDQLEFIDLGKGKSVETNLEVQNFSDREWKSVSLHPSAEWLTASSLPVAVAKGLKETPQQVWRVIVTANSAAMSVGEHHAYVEVSADGADGLVRKIPIACSVMSPVIAIPGQFFFGEVDAHKPCSRTISLRFAPNAVPPGPEAVRLEHDLGAQLVLKWLTTEGSSWELSATLTPGGGEITGRKVNISFSDPELPSVVLPVYGSIQDK